MKRLKCAKQISLDSFKKMLPSNFSLKNQIYKHDLMLNSS